MSMGLDMEGETYRQGYLQRKKSVAKTVKKRWFSLNSDTFITFKSEESAQNSSESLEVLPLMNVQTVKKQHTNSNRYPFEIITRQKTHVFLTESAYEQDQWVKAFHSAMQSRSFNAERNQVPSKFTTNGKEKRSSTGPKKHSQKKYVQDGWKAGPQRKSSGVDCDPSETAYQGISIGMDIDNADENDDVFESKKCTSPTTKSPPTVQYVTIHGNGTDSGSSRGQSRDSDDSGQGTHDVRNVDSRANNATKRDDVNDARPKSLVTDANSPDSSSSESAVTSEASSSAVSLPVPPPVPTSSGLSRSPKRVFEDEQIYDEPPRVVEDIYDVPPREQEESSPKSSAMSDLQRILDADTDDGDDGDIDVDAENGGGYDSEYDNAEPYEEYDSLEEALTEQGVAKSAMDELKDLLDSFDEL